MLTTWNKNGNGLGVWLAWTTIGRMTSWCGNPAKGDEIEADPKSAGLKRSTNISAKRRIGPKWQKMAPSGWTWRRPSSGVAEHGGGLHPEWLNMEEAFIQSGLQMAANDDDANGCPLYFWSGEGEGGKQDQEAPPQLQCCLDERHRHSHFTNWFTNTENMHALYTYNCLGVILKVS